GAFLAAAFFLAGAFLAAAFFLAGAFLAAAFLAGAFLAGAFLAGAFAAGSSGSGSGTGSAPGAGAALPYLARTSWIRASRSAKSKGLFSQVSAAKRGEVMSFRFSPMPVSMMTPVEANASW